MTWQDAGVALVVMAALWFLYRRVFAAPPKKGSTTFVPLGQVKRHDDRGCH